MANTRLLQNEMKMIQTIQLTNNNNAKQRPKSAEPVHRHGEIFVKNLEARTKPRLLPAMSNTHSSSSARVSNVRSLSLLSPEHEKHSLQPCERPNTGTPRILYPAPHFDFSITLEREPFADTSYEVKQKLIEDLKGREANRRGMMFLVYDDSAPVRAHDWRRDERTNSFLPAAALRDLNDEALVFESRFEGGNLQRAVRVGLYEYELHLRTDWNTAGHTQWCARAAIFTCSVL